MVRVIRWLSVCLIVMSHADSTLEVFFRPDILENSESEQTILTEINQLA